MFSVSDTVNMFTEIFSENSDLDEFEGHLLLFPLELSWDRVINLS